MRPKPPCLNCSERIVGCHSECDLYNTFRRALDEYKKKCAEQIYNQADQYLIETTIKKRRK